MNSQNVYEYKKVKTIDEKEFRETECEPYQAERESKMYRLLKNKINEMVIEQNHLMKDFELYKKAFKRFVSEARNETK